MSILRLIEKQENNGGDGDELSSLGHLTDGYIFRQEKSACVNSEWEN